MISSLGFFKSIVSVWWNELREMSRDLGVIIFFVVLPLAYPVLYYFVYSTEVARDVPVAVVDECNSARTRDFIRRVDASPEAAVMAKCANLSEAQDLMARGVVFGVVRIPSSFEEDLRSGRQTRVGVYTDVSSMIYYKNVLLPCTNVSQEMNKSIKVEVLGQRMTDREIAVAKSPIAYEHVQLYNPQGGYASFLIPPIMMLIIQQALVIGVGIAMGRTREKNRGNAFYMGVSGYERPVAVVLGRVFVIVPVFLIMALYMQMTVTLGCGLPMLAHYGSWVAFLLPYLLACACFSIVCSFLIYRREDSMLLFVFMSIPLLFLSGVSWPASNIPALWQWVASAFPSTFGLNAHVRITSMGADVAAVSHELIWLWGHVAFYFVVACLLQYRATKSTAHGESSAMSRLRAE